MDAFLRMFAFLVERLKNFPSKWRFRTHLVRHWSTVGWHIDRATWEFGLPGRRLKPVPLESVLPGIIHSSATIQIERPWDREQRTSLQIDELCVLLSIVKEARAERILEVGAYDGNTALNLALNLPAEGRVVTIDLPAVEKSNANPSPVIGRQLRDSVSAWKVTLVREDTALLDWKKLPGPFDLIFIDGCHDYRYVKNDTEKAMTVLSPGGLLVWHDYNLPGVGQWIDEFSRIYPCHWIQGTRFVTSRPQPSV